MESANLPLLLPLLPSYGVRRRAGSRVSAPCQPAVRSCEAAPASLFILAILAASISRFVLYDQADSLFGSYLIAVSACSRPRVTHCWIFSKSLWSLGFW